VVAVACNVCRFRSTDERDIKFVMKEPGMVPCPILTCRGFLWPVYARTFSADELIGAVRDVLELPGFRDEMAEQGEMTIEEFLDRLKGWLEDELMLSRGRLKRSVG